MKSFNRTLADRLISCQYHNRGDPSQHRSSGIVKIFNRTLADRLISCQCHNPGVIKNSKSNREWVSGLQNVVSALNNEKLD